MREDIYKYNICLYVCPSLLVLDTKPFIACTVNKMSVGFYLPIGKSLLNHFSNMMREREILCYSDGTFK